jgi:hypothetical protein
MRRRWRQRIPGLLLWLAGSLVGALVIVRLDIAQRRAQFLAEAQIAHRLLSQRAAQHDAILQTLVLLSAPRPAEPPAPRGNLSSPAKPDLLRSPGSADPPRPDQRLAALYPQIVNVLRRDEAGS